MRRDSDAGNTAAGDGQVAIDVYEDVSALKPVARRWQALKGFSLGRLCLECERNRYDYGNDEEFLAFLVRQSDAKIDKTLRLDRDQLLSRSCLAPSLVYDLLLENGELRKMANAYQLRVYVLDKGRRRQGSGSSGSSK